MDESCLPKVQCPMPIMTSNMTMTASSYPTYPTGYTTPVAPTNGYTYNYSTPTVAPTTPIVTPTLPAFTSAAARETGKVGMYMFVACVGLLVFVVI